MRVVAYTYEASEHCVPCALECFGADEHGHVPEGARDADENEVGAVFQTDLGEWDRDLVCGTCGELIEEAGADEEGDD